MSWKMDKDFIANALDKAGLKVQGANVAKSDAAAAKKLTSLMIKVDSAIAKLDRLVPFDRAYFESGLYVFGPNFTPPSGLASPKKKAVVRWDIRYGARDIGGRVVYVTNDLLVYWADSRNPDKVHKLSSTWGQFKKECIEHCQENLDLAIKEAENFRKEARKPKTDEEIYEDKMIEVICDSWTLPAKKDVTTPKGVMKCWFVEHGDDQGYKKKASIDGKVYSEDPHEGWKAGDDNISFIEKYWVDPSKKVVNTPEGTMKCWVEAHPEGADRGGYLGKAEIDGKVFTEHPVDGWELG